MKTNKLSLLFIPVILLCSCSNNTLSLWNKSFKSNGKTFVNWDEKITDIDDTRLNVIKDNFNNIDFENSGYTFYIDDQPFFHSFKLISDLYDFPIDNFANFKSSIDSWWDNDMEFGDFSSFYGLKKGIDKSIFKISLESQIDGINKGKLVMSFQDPIKEKATQHDDYYCFDNTPQQKGNYLNLYKDENGEKVVGYVEEIKLCNGENILHFRTGYNDDSFINFTFVLKTPIKGINTFILSSCICIKEYKSFPIWAIILISLGGLIIIGFIIILIVFKTKKKEINSNI